MSKKSNSSSSTAVFLFSGHDLPEDERALIRLRRDFHRHPESAWTEYRTTAVILRELKAAGIPVLFGPALHKAEARYGLPDPEADEAAFRRAAEELGGEEEILPMRGGFTGCMAVIEGALPGPVKVLRVDIDCNEVAESRSETHRPCREGFASVHDGLTHGCGHDGHAAIGVVTAQMIARCRDRLPGTVKILFQPGEEGLRGAASMAAAGLVDDASLLLGGHLGLTLTRPGAVAASATEILSSTKLDLFFEGKAAHAGMYPQLGRNALAAAAAAATNMLAIARHGDGASRINIGYLQAGSGRNVIPPSAEMHLETRGASAEINRYMLGEVRRIAHAAAEMYGCSCRERIVGSADSVESTPLLVERELALLQQMEEVREVLRVQKFGAGEDVTTLMRVVQENGGMAAELMFGTPLVAPHHNGSFDFDEAVLILAAKVFAEFMFSL